MTDPFLLDVFRSMCGLAWIMFFLVMKNIVLIGILAYQRRKNAIYKIPEDVNTFGSGQQPTNTDDWSLAGRIQRVLANDTEYVPYFFGLIIILFCTIQLTSQDEHHYLSRVLSYGVLFTVGRYLHTIGYLIRNSYARILGFLLTIVILFILSVDHIYYMTKRLHNYERKP